MCWCKYRISVALTVQQFVLAYIIIFWAEYSNFRRSEPSLYEPHYYSRPAVCTTLPGEDFWRWATHRSSYLAAHVFSRISLPTSTWKVSNLVADFQLSVSACSITPDLNREILLRSLSRKKKAHGLTGLTSVSRQKVYRVSSHYQMLFECIVWPQLPKMWLFYNLLIFL